PQRVCLRELGVLSVKHRPAEDTQLYLNNRIAVVTGAAGAIGYGVCKGLLKNGCFLAATDLVGKKLDDFSVELKSQAGEHVIGFGLDVTDKASVVRGFEKIIQTWGGIDIVVVNAGIAMVSNLKDMDIDDFRRLEKVNVEGALLTISEAARYLILQGTGGDIIVISTKSVPSPGAGFGAYSATKAACYQLGRVASLELAQYGIRVNMVAPDAVFSEGKYKSGLWQQIGPDRMQSRGLDEKGLEEYYRDRNLLKAKITGQHVANAVLFFATRQTPTTGATIPVDGGLPDATPR
ncbi:MAG: SDR family NAD(P)-dependent oxidoreductase, partial [Planctomycetota bacterium]